MRGRRRVDDRRRDGDDRARSQRAPPLGSATSKRATSVLAAAEQRERAASAGSSAIAASRSGAASRKRRSPASASSGSAAPQPRPPPPRVPGRTSSPPARGEARRDRRCRRRAAIRARASRVPSVTAAAYHAPRSCVARRRRAPVSGRRRAGSGRDGDVAVRAERSPCSSAHRAEVAERALGERELLLATARAAPRAAGRARSWRSSAGTRCAPVGHVGDAASRARWSAAARAAPGREQRAPR